MPANRSSRREPSPRYRTNPYANAAAAHQGHATRAASAATLQEGGRRRRQQQTARVISQDGNLMLRLPAELRNRIYDFFAPKTHKVTLDASDKITAMGPHPLSRTCKQIRGEYLSRVPSVHRARYYNVIVRDFDFGKLMYHLRQNNRLARLGRITIRMNITSPLIDHSGLIAWFKFTRRYSLEPRYKPWVMPLVAVRREFMGNVLNLEREFGGNWEEQVGLDEGEADKKRPYPEIVHVTKPLMKFWAKGKGEMRWAKPGEKPPGGKDWEKDAGSDNDSSGDES